MNIKHNLTLLGTGLLLGAGAMLLTAACTADPTPTPPPADTAPVTEVPEVVAPPMPNITLVPCATEDSTNCYWNAATMGNGSGTSFVDIDGTIYYPR